MSTSDTNEVSPETAPLDAVIREYLLRIDRGEEISHKELLASHPDLHDDLQAFFEGVALVQKMAGAPSALTETSPPTKFDTKYATVATPEDGSSDVNSKTSHSKSAADLTGSFPIMLGQYRVLKNIGQGAMGAVYVADDIRLGRKVALKVPLASVVEHADHLDRFTREARASARLRHHNICPVYEVNEQDGIQYIAMAYIEGQPLLEVMRKSRRFTGKQIAVTIRKIAQALEVAHRAGIVHRDLKPANIMIDKDGEPIVMDFGLARQIHTADQVQLTQEGVILGTPAYMSPEQVRSELKRIGPASDIYSLGVILYELLCGSHPFRGPLMTVLMNVADKNIKPRKPSEIRPNCDPQLEAICLRMISKRIADRYPTMKDVAAALSHYIKAGQTAPEIPTTESPVNQPAAEPIAISAATPASTPKPELLKTESAGTSKPPRRRVGVLFGGFLAALLAGVIIITITTQEGKITEIRVPEGTRIDIPAAPGAKVSIAVSKDPAPPADNKTKSGWHGWPADAPKPAIAPFDAAQAKKHQAEWAAYLKVPVEYTNSIGMKFMLIPPGEFLMGSTPEVIDALLPVRGDGFSALEVTNWKTAISSEGPRQPTTITRPFYLAIQEVTQAAYEKVTGQNPSTFSSSGTGKDAVNGQKTALHPVESLTWNECAEFCSRLSQIEQFKPRYFRTGDLVNPLPGAGYRLPTEAEWELASRGGTTTQRWVGDAIEAATNVAWLRPNSGDRTHAVGELLPNPFGLYDVLGNVSEYCEDGADADIGCRPYTSERAVDPRLSWVGRKLRVLRGGDYKWEAACSRSAFRNNLFADSRTSEAGFRPVLDFDAVRMAIDQRNIPSVNTSTSWHGWPADAPAPAIAPFNADQAKNHQQAWARYLKVPVEYTNSIGMKFALIPPGEFMMGSTRTEIEKVFLSLTSDERWQQCVKSEAPQHKVVLTSPIYLGLHEVTQQNYAQIMARNPSLFSATGSRKDIVKDLDTQNFPVEAVSWNDATEFCAKISQKEKLAPWSSRVSEVVTPLDGTGYRLPSEAEWEFSCRAGTTTRFWMGESDEKLILTGWYAANSQQRVHSVGKLAANPFGLFDMNGNLWEWVDDYWDQTFYSHFSETPAINPNNQLPTGTNRVLKGGDWTSTIYDLRSSSRYIDPPTIGSEVIGFRVALPIDAVRQALKVSATKQSCDSPNLHR